MKYKVKITLCQDTTTKRRSLHFSHKDGISGFRITPKKDTGCYNIIEEFECDFDDALLKEFAELSTDNE